MCPRVIDLMQNSCQSRKQLIYSGLHNQSAQLLLEQTNPGAQILRTAPLQFVIHPPLFLIYNRQSAIVNRKLFVTFSTFSATYATI